MMYEDLLEKIGASKEELRESKMDVYDGLIAGFCGAAAGVIDVFFVGDPSCSKLSAGVDNVADGLVKKAAKMFWNKDGRTNGKSKKCPETLEQCISYLEQAFPINYDARYAKDLIVEEGVLKGMSPKNHHLLSLAHSPDLIGLIFSIIDQFNPAGSATFVDHGRIIHVVPRKTSDAIPYLSGTNLHSKLFCGFVNWIGHLLSDLVGSSSTRKKGGHGAGIPIPFYELFLGCEFGPKDKATFAETMVKVFEKGYDARFGATMAIPVLLEELMIKAIWVVRQKFERKKPWQDCIPTVYNRELRQMLLLGNGVLCSIDLIDAGIRGGVSQNPVVFFSRLNFVGWARFVALVLKTIKIELGLVIDPWIESFKQDLIKGLNLLEQREKLLEFYKRMDEPDTRLDTAYSEFVEVTEKEYELLCEKIDAAFDEDDAFTERVSSSVELAELSGVAQEDVLTDTAALDDFFLS